MIAYVILTHRDFATTSELVARIYHPDNLYCVCVNAAAFADALDSLNFLRVLPNVHIVPTPLTSWGIVLEAYLYGIEFCLKIDESWRSLILLSGSDIPLVSQQKILAELSSTYRDKIVLQAFEAVKEFNADCEIQDRILQDPFRLIPAESFDGANYNPFTYPRPNYRREGITLYSEPDAMRAGWSRTSHFVTHLVRQSRDRGRNTGYFETVSPFLRNLLKIYFKDRVASNSPVYGIFPRDFCHYSISDESALTYFQLIQNAHAAEESYFATLLHNSKFLPRHVRRCMTYTAKRTDNLLALEDLTERVIEDHFFARKVAVGEAGANLYVAAYGKLGIERSSEVPEWPVAGPKDYRTLLFDRFKSNVNIVDTVFSCGIVGERVLCDIVFGSDGLLHYSCDPPGVMGYEWCWADAGIDIFSRGQRFARFDGLRIHEGRLLIFGYWYHAEALTLACVADVAPMLAAGALPDRHAPEYGDITEHLWSFWFSNNLVSELIFKPDGTIAASDDVDRLEGFWRDEDGVLLTFGVHDMPIALFEHRSVAKDGRQQIAGVSWGRRLPIEPCLLAQLPPPDERLRALGTTCDSNESSGRVTMSQAPASETIDYGSALHVRNGSSALLVWFSGLHGSFLNPRFLSNERGILLDGLFLKDVRSDWYTGGFEGLAENFSDSVAWLENLIRSNGYERVFLTGQSSGAYAAMRVARRTRPTAVIVFAPQTRNMINTDGRKEPNVDLEDLAKSYADWKGEYPVYIHLSRSEMDNKHLFFWDDWNQIESFLDRDNVTIIRHPFDVHVVTIPLYDRGLFYKTLLSNLMLHMPDVAAHEPVTDIATGGPTNA